MLAEVGEQGVDPGEFLYPSGLAVHGNEVHVTDNGNSAASLSTTSNCIICASGARNLRPWATHDDVGYLKPSMSTPTAISTSLT
ncbi:MAG: hypothetical protein R3A46_21725 [Thermomicrobiales bacterium]